MPIDLKKYPKDWATRSRFVRHYRAKNQCEWCGAKNHEPHPVTGSRVVLTTAHVHNKDPMAASLLNLAALCQKCHLTHDAPDREAARRQKARQKAQDQAPTSCVEVIRLGWIKTGMKQSKIARGMGLSPSALSRKLAQSPDDSRRFTLDDLERYMEVTGDTEPVLYLIEKYLGDEGKQIEELERRLEELRQRASPVRRAS